MDKFKVLSTSPTFGKYAPEAVEMLQDNECRLVQLTPEEVKDPERVMFHLRDADGWIFGVDKVTRSHLAAAPKLQVVAKHGTGVDSVDLEAARERNVVIANVPAANSNAVADLTMGLLLAAARKIVFADKQTRAGGWGPIMGTELWGKTLGVIGLGAIGRGVVKRAAGFGMRFLAYDVFPNEQFARDYGVQYLSIPEVLKEADFVTIHAPLTAETRGLIGEQELAMMKSSAFLINTSRGPIVQEKALCIALREGLIAGAALDVFETEPPAQSELMELDNVVVTPHMGAYTYEAMANISLISARNVIEVLRGNPPLYRVQ
ncbi:hypothetical protein SY88_12370 [Clostridiales bacterium PH28_bin88]|nr:hypothetical protein SY88_12370 [Clostridiales bacterium PH28_bin88]